MTNQTLAYANINGEGAGDYVHFILGVQPTKALGRNNFVISITPSSTTDSLGVLASIHVAYRVKKEGVETTAWTEVDVYGENHGTTKKGTVSSNVTGAIEKAYKDAASVTSVPAGTMACVIRDLDTQMNKVTQIEVVIYMAGADSDCNDQGKTSSGDIMMFFDTENAQTAAPTAATVDANGELTVTGVTGATVEYQVEGSAEWKTIQGNWNTTRFTSTEKLPEATKGKKINIRLTRAGEDPSDSLQATSTAWV